MAADDEFSPGAAPFGNFINYYSFNPPENRLKLLPAEFYTIIKKNCADRLLLGLDIGCNSGDLTAALLEQFLSHSTGDSHEDSSAALQTNRSPEDSTAALQTTRSPEDSTAALQTIRSPEDSTTALQTSRSPEDSTAALQTSQHTDFHIMGCDIDNILIQRAAENNRRTDRLTFQSLDYMSTEQRQETLGGYLQRFGRTKFDVTFCFSVTMWIHLQNGDSGLMDFLRSVSRWTRFLLLEPQPWKCYRSAGRRLRKLGREGFPLLGTLQIRSDVEQVIDRCLKECSMTRVETFGETQWGRKLVLYHSKEEELL
ncbi:pre-miRNA 5'-monophosphate methyltransferase-like [Branchiostoma lanceolatum]|uniref:pre-miRNA 5'-monophosphate methyltransferase-like n=1 Tax=Branchiostoma lanceolatum TaxID=7740 RepID=UPI0034570321